MPPQSPGQVQATTSEAATAAAAQPEQRLSAWCRAGGRMMGNTAGNGAAAIEGTNTEGGARAGYATQFGTFADQ